MTCGLEVHVKQAGPLAPVQEPSCSQGHTRMMGSCDEMWHLSKPDTTRFQKNRC